MHRIMFRGHRFIEGKTWGIVFPLSPIGAEARVNILKDNDMILLIVTPTSSIPSILEVMDPDPSSIWMLNNAGTGICSVFP